MLRSQLVDRVKSLEEAVEKSVAQHNALVGRLQESREMLSFFVEGDELANVIDDIAECAACVPVESDVQE